MSDKTSKTGAAVQQAGLAAAVFGAVALTVVIVAVGKTVFGWSTLIIVGVFCVIAGVAGFAAWVTYPRWGASQADRKLRDTSKLTDVMGGGAVAKGADLRGLSEEERRTAKATSVAVTIGSVKGKPVYKTLEDFTLIIMGPRSNKTSSQAVPRILSALGSVVATSNKPDLWILTAGLRRRLGPVYGFDPGNIAFVEQTFWWNILAQVTDFRSAKRLATHFMASAGKNNSESGNSGFFASESTYMLARTMLAAALTPGRTMRDVIAWVDTSSREPIALLRAAGRERFASALQAQLDGATETLAGVRSGASGALECLQDEEVLRWVTPPESWEEAPDREIEELDLWSLYMPTPGNVPSLYLMSEEGAESAGPVVAAMVDTLFKLSKQASSAAGGRCDPPPSFVLDEAANICRIEDLPAQASHLGSRGVLVDVILQSYQQGMGVWGRERMGAMWGASTCRIVGAGLQEISDARMISDLIGTHEVWKKSYSYGSGPSGKTMSRSLVREPIMPPEEVAALDRD
ncbi:MAG: TraM recognition domain-containing protein, partial [Gordonia sp. (in: high G+C Gram-positive bacteria)]|nr:TraM recognition domain-containing protein [Gordonia sp. (in: high G+C Gram-positive bacteria)]